MKKEWVVWIILLTMVVGSYCFVQWHGRLYGFSYNNERKVLGIPVLDRGFFGGKDSAYWYNSSSTIPRHATKHVATRFGFVDIEKDVFELLSDSIQISLLTFYHHDRDCYHLFTKSGDAGARTAVTCEAANELLIKNGLPQLRRCKPCEDEIAK